MKTEIISMKISKLLDLDASNSLNVNEEYQRAEVWKDDQKKKLLDSILRGFPIPMLILFKSNISENKYDIVDGQQRRAAIRDFYNKNDFKLLNVNNPKYKFPTYLRSISCDWADKNFHNLSEENKESFLNYNIPVCIVSEASDVELRDIFIRLQSGTPLSSQETRDAMPGEFSQFIRDIGGDKNNDGHDFIEGYFKKTKTDRGKIRQLVSQIFLLFVELETNGRFSDIKAQKLDEIYYEYISMDDIQVYKNRFVEVLNELYSCIDDSKLENHEIIHLFLFAKECKNLGLNNWKVKIGKAFNEFKSQLSKFKKDESSSFWINYLAKTRVNSDQGKNIMERHRFFSEKMLNKMYDTINVDIIEIKDEQYLWEHALLDRYLELSEAENSSFKDELMAFFVPSDEQVFFEKSNEEVISLDKAIEFVTHNSKDNPDYDKILNYLKEQRSNSIKRNFRNTENNIRQNTNQEVYRMTSIKAFRKDGKEEKGTTFGNLIPRLYPEEFDDKRSRNYPGLILGTDRGLNIFEKFWQDYDQVEFLMKNKIYKVKRKDFDTFWPNRFPTIS